MLRGAFLARLKQSTGRRPPRRAIISALGGHFRRFVTFQALLFLIQHSIDFRHQRHQLFRILFNGGLFAHSHPFFFNFPLHHAYSNLASVGRRLRGTWVIACIRPNLESP
jgi:hypothetical protein